MAHLMTTLARFESAQLLAKVKFIQRVVSAHPSIASASQELGITPKHLRKLVASFDLEANRGSPGGSNKKVSDEELVRQFHSPRTIKEICWIVGLGPTQLQKRWRELGLRRYKERKK